METDELKQISHHEWRRALWTTGVVLVIFLIQHYGRRFGQPIETIYFTIIFASIALTGLTMISASYLMGPLSQLWPGRWAKYRDLRKQFGLIGVAFVMLHVVLALTVLTPAYYPKIFSASGKLSELGQISMLTGAVAFVTLLVVMATSLSSVAETMTERGWLIVQRSGLLAVILSVIHFVVFKWRGWFDLKNWHNYIPPGTFVVTAFVIFVFLVRLAAYIRKRLGTK